MTGKAAIRGCVKKKTDLVRAHVKASEVSFKKLSSVRPGVCDRETNAKSSELGDIRRIWRFFGMTADVIIATRTERGYSRKVAFSDNHHRDGARETILFSCDFVREVFPHAAETASRI